MSAIAFLLLAAAAATPSAVTHTTAGELAATLEHARPSGPASFAAQLGAHSDYRLFAIRRTAAGSAELHQTEDDIWYVLDGGGTLVTGGEMVGGATTAKGEQRGRSIRNGTARHVGRGDVVTIDARTPHWLSAVDGEIRYLTVKVPRRP